MRVVYFLYYSNSYVYPVNDSMRWSGFTVCPVWLDRKAVPTIVAVRRGDVSAIEIEVVRIELRLVGGTIPVVASAARGPQRASSHIHEPATS